MSYDPEGLYRLLPAVYRVRDADLKEALPPGVVTEEDVLEPLRAFLAVLAEQARVVEESIEQLYDDQFIETCAEWVVPYIGELVGNRSLHTATRAHLSERAQVANTLAYRRRKGTAAVLEQLARDVTNWDARAVEFFQRLIATQYLNHVRLGNLATVDLRDRAALEYLGTPFETANHTLEVRRIASRRGRYNIPNVGIFLWRIGAHSSTHVPAFRVDSERYRFSPLGHDMPLYTRPDPEPELQHLADPINAPLPITRRTLSEEKDRYYGDDPRRGVRSILVKVDGTEIGADDIDSCDLSDVASTWAHVPRSRYAIDPVLGRLVIPQAVASASPPPRVEVTYHYGFSDDLGGGEYERAETFDPELEPVRHVSGGDTPAQPALEPALTALGGVGVLEIGDGKVYHLGAVTPAVEVAEDERLELRAANEVRPLVRLGANTVLRGRRESELTINGLLVAGATLVVEGELARLVIRHCTLVPGVDLTAAGQPATSSGVSLEIRAENVEVEIERSIVGAIRAVQGSSVTIVDSVVDATDPAEVAYAAPDGTSPGGTLTIERSTVIGRVHAERLPLVSNTILNAAEGTTGPWTEPVRVRRRQEGCVRFSYVPPESQVPRRTSCRPATGDDDRRMQPQFTSLRYGNAAYCQLSLRTPHEIRAGADDEAEMGVFHDLFQPQRETNLRLRLDEYLRFGLEAGIFYAS